jgi:hypothetical protein
MASTKWTVPSVIEAAIENIEQQLAGSQLNSYGVKEHRYTLRFIVGHFSEKRRLAVATPVLAKDGKPVLENGKPKVETQEQECWVLTPAGQKEMARFFAEQSNFVCYASNAKKLLIEAGVLDKDIADGVADYE